MTSLKLLRELLGERSDSPRLKSFLEQVASGANISPPEPEVKAYGNDVYFNYYTLGISLMFIGPANTNRKSRDYREYVLDSIDIYNPHSAKNKFVAFSLLPIEVTATTDTAAAEGGGESEDSKRQSLSRKSTGEDIVRILGEPERKGGGSGPSSGSISIWCEWSKKGIMVEFGGDSARGPQAWERGKDAVWEVLSLFPAKTNRMCEDNQ